MYRIKITDLRVVSIFSWRSARNEIKTLIINDWQDKRFSYTCFLYIHSDLMSFSKVSWFSALLLPPKYPTPKLATEPLRRIRFGSVLEGVSTPRAADKLIDGAANTSNTLCFLSLLVPHKEDKCAL